MKQCSKKIKRLNRLGKLIRCKDIQQWYCNCHLDFFVKKILAVSGMGFTDKDPIPFLAA
jgi:hypothetical protein